MKHLLTVVMSVRNQHQFLENAIDSILDQTYSKSNFIIIDDASGSKTKQILNAIKDKRVKIITNSRHLGLAESLNIAIASSQSTYIARMDADDISIKSRLKTQLNFLLTHPKVAVCGSQVTLMDGNFRII